MHLESYDLMGKQLFLQTLRIMSKEMKKRYKRLDPILVLNLAEIERISEMMITEQQRQQPS